VTAAPATQDIVVRKSGAGTVSGLLRATDVDGDTLRFRIVRGPARGKVTVDPATGRFVYTPQPGAKRIDVTFRYVANDGKVDSDRAIVMIDYCNGRHDGHNHDRDDDDRYDRHDRDEHDRDWGWDRDRDR
jgi:Bacterial Ig domain